MSDTQLKRRPIETAPRDGTWVVLFGEMRGGDTETAMVGRWNPAGKYEWECFYGWSSGIMDDTYEPAPLSRFLNHYPTGRVLEWMPLPGAPLLEAELAYYKGFHDGVCKDGTHVVVPVEPTPEMELAIYNASGLRRGEEQLRLYRAMIRAAQESVNDSVL